MNTKLLIFFTVLLSMANTAAAATLYGTGFENPPFSALIPLVGQDGWSGVPGLSLNAARVSTGVIPRQGKQSVLVRGANLQNDQTIPVNQITAGYYDAIGNYRKTIDVDSLGKKSVRISAHVRLIGKKTVEGNNFFSVSIGGRGADVLSSVPSGTTGIGELAISSDGHVYGYSGNEDVPGCENIPCNPPASFLASKPISLNESHVLAVTVNFKKRTYAFSADDGCMGTFPFPKVDDDGDPATPPVYFTGNFLRRGFMNVYAAPDTADLKKANYSGTFDQFKISLVEGSEDCIP